MKFDSSKLYGISNKKYLAELLNVDKYKLRDVEKHFNTVPFNKITNGKERNLYNPSPEHKKILKKLNRLLQPIGAADYVYGGIKGRSYAMNAHLHKDNEFFCLIDLKNFFPSTRDSFVYSFFNNKLNMSSDIAKICTLLTTEKTPGKLGIRHLPQGFSTSPYLSYLSYISLFEDINKISISNNMDFSCYYDDLTISSSVFINKGVRRNIIKRINHYNLEVNVDKSRLLKNKLGVKITGAVIRGNKLVAPNRLQNKLFKRYDVLMRTYHQDIFENDKIISLCNEVQGLMTAVGTVETNRDLQYIKKSLKEIRGIVKQ